MKVDSYQPVILPLIQKIDNLLFLRTQSCSCFLPVNTRHLVQFKMGSNEVIYSEIQNSNFCACGLTEQQTVTDVEMPFATVL